MNKLKGLYRTFMHNILYKENYYRNVMIVLFSLLLLNILLIIIVW